MGDLGVHLSQQLPVEKVVAVAQMADAFGYQRFFFSDHLARDPFAILTACALKTQRVSVGPAVMPLFARHPVAAAIGAATLDHISGGRFVFGIGTSHPEMITSRLGIPWHKPVGHLREYVEIVRALHRGGAVSYQGEHYQVDYQLPFPPSRPTPIYLGPSRPRMFELSGQLADGVVLNWGSPDYLAGRLKELYAAAGDAGREPSAVEIGCSLWCAVTAAADETAQVRDRFRGMMGFFVRFGTYRQRFGELGFQDEMEAAAAALERGEPVPPLIPDALLDVISVLGDVDFCRNRLEEYRRAGIELPLVVPLTTPDGDLDPIRRTLAALSPAGQ